MTATLSTRLLAAIAAVGTTSTAGAGRSTCSNVITTG
jgi:hypothetical protein